MKHYIKPYTFKELITLYEVPDKTFRKWLRPFKDLIGPKVGQFYTINQVRIMFDKLGIPARLEDD